MNKSPRARLFLTVLSVGLLSIQAGLDRAFGRSLVLGMGADEPVTAAAVLTSVAGVESATVTPAAPAAVAAPAASTPTLGSVLKGAFSSLGDKTKLGADLAQTRADLATANTNLTAARAEATAANTALDTMAAFFGMKRTELAGKDATAIGALIATKISESAIEELATAGVPPAALPKPSAGTGNANSDKLEDVQAAMATTTDPKELGRLAAKANALRDAAWSGKN